MPKVEQSKNNFGKLLLVLDLRSRKNKNRGLSEKIANNCTSIYNMNYMILIIFCPKY